MQELISQLVQMVERLPVVSIRMTPESQGWRAAFVTQNVAQYGHKPEDFLDGSFTWLDMISPDAQDAERAEALKALRAHMQGSDKRFRLQYRVRSPQGKAEPVTAYFQVSRREDGEPDYIDAMLFRRSLEADGQELVDENVAHQLSLNDILISLMQSDGQAPLRIILDKAASHLGVSRAQIMFQPDAQAPCQLIYEWLDKAVLPLHSPRHDLLCGNDNKEIRTALDKNGLYVVNAGEIPRKISDNLRERGVVSAVVSGVQLGGLCRACLRLEDHITPHVWDEAALDFITNVSQLISSVLLRQNDAGDNGNFSQKTCETVLDNVDSFIFVTEPETGEILFANRAFRNVFGDDCLGKPSENYLELGSEQETEIFQSPEKAKNNQVGFETFLEKTGQWFAVTRDLVPWVNGVSVHLNNCYDITFKKRYEESIKRLAYLDHLTSLPNRYRCDTDLRIIMSRAKRRGESGYLLFIDLDDFKIVNDSYGHHYGDGVLVSFASYLQDAYGDKHHVYRFGGDEFVLIIMDCDQKCIIRHLKALLDRARKPWKALNREFYCSLSIGVVQITAEDADAKIILQRADIAMYQAKKSSKNSYVFYTEGLENATIERSEMEWLLREAMSNNFQGFEIHYQPYMRTSDLKILGAEALVRMRDQDGKLLLPGAFVPLAEYLGFIVPLGEHILRTAAGVCKAINDSGFPDFCMTINLSARQFQQKEIVERLEGILREAGVNFANIIIAINEGVAINELERMLKICSEFRENGIRIALDDFGSGNSSFINMRNLPVDIIKVSSNYIDDYQDEYSGYFIRLVADLSHYSGKLVCMNGVETEEHYNFCKELGLDMMQGFLLHRPDSMAALQALLEKQAGQPPAAPEKM